MMVFFTTIFLILLNNFSWSNEPVYTDLMSQYEALQPFHENITIIMPEKNCKNVKNKPACQIDMKWEDNSEPLEELLHTTENAVDTESPEFIHTPLGQKYHKLKKFMNVHKKLKSCSADTHVIQDEILYRTQSNISLALQNSDTCDASSSNSKNSIALFGNHLHEVLRGKTTKASAFEDALFSQALKTSIQSRINFTRQTGNDNINTPNFKQKLLDKFCAGDAPQSTSRGAKNKKNWACSEKDKEIINNLIEEAVRSISHKELLQHPTKHSQQKEECFFQNRRKKKCINTNIYEFQSIPPELAGANQMDSLSPSTVVADINYRISNLNSILENYNNQKKTLEEQWALENPREKYSSLPEKRKAEHQYSLKRKKFDNELKKFKKQFFLEYKRELALLHTSGAGFLLQTDAIRNKSNFKEIEKITGKGLGLFGFEETELTHQENFPLLEPINDRTANLAVQEGFQRMDQHISSLLSDQREKHKTDQEYLDRLQKDSFTKEDLQKWYNDQRFERLSKLILSSPQTLSPVLLDQPEYSSILCEITSKIKKDRQFIDMIKTGLLVGSAIGSVTVAVLTLGTGAPASFATYLSLVAGTGLTAADLTLRISEINKHSTNQEDLLNAYLSQTGDDQSIEDIRKEWKSKVKEQFHAGWTSSLGIFDIYRIGSFVQKTGRLSRQKTSNLKNNTLQKTIAENTQYTESIQSLMQTHSLRSVQKLLNSIKKLPPDQQRIVLDSFPKITQHHSFNLTAFSREIERSATKKRITETLQKWSVCISCKLRAGQKQQRESNDSTSVIESSRL